jgi:Kef-type K+ transport system membrane component KefB
MSGNLKLVTVRVIWLSPLLLLMVAGAAARQTRQSAKQATAAANGSDQKTAVTDQQAAGQQKPKPPERDLVPPPPNLPLDTGSYVDQPLPILIAPPPPLPPPIKPSARPLNLQSASEVIKVVLGLVFMFALAYLAGTSRVQALENKLQVTNVVAAGLPFVFLGVVAHMRGVGILSEPVLWELRPLLALGLGWIGFATGFRFDSKLAESIMPGVSAVSLITASIPFGAIVAACALLLVYVEHSHASAIFLRDAMMLGTAGAMTAYKAPRFLQARGTKGGHPDRVASIITLEQLAGFIGLLIVAAYFRPQDNSVAWHLPGTAWLFITLGMGTMIGGVVWVTLAKIKAGPEFTVLILGSVCFTAGMASFLRISPLVVCFIVGLILVNLPGTSKDEIRQALEHMERPIYLLFLLVAGSLWDMTAWQGWALMLLFVPARLFGKWLAVRLCRQKIASGLSIDEQRSLIFSPMGALSIAIVVNAQDLYYGSVISWMVTAVIGGAIVTEVIVHIASRRTVFEQQRLSSLS